MMDFTPTIIDGAIVFTLKKPCEFNKDHCESCNLVTVYLHNWIKLSNLNYLVFDFMDAKEICSTFLEELQQLQRRFGIPFLYSGVMQKPKLVIDRFCTEKNYPLFVTPEDAIRALRMQYPGVTENPPRIQVFFEESFVNQVRHQDSEIASVMV